MANIGSFFDQGRETQTHVDDLMYAGIGEMSMSNIQGDARVFRSGLMEAANRLLQFEKMAGNMGARSAQARMGRLMSAGSGMGDIGQGYTLGAGFGASAGLTYQAMRDSVDLAMKRRGARSSMLMQGAQLSAGIPRKSGWDVAKDVGQTVGQLAMGFGGNPFSMTSGMADGFGPGAMPNPALPPPPSFSSS